jgi:hypothetical protein
VRVGSGIVALRAAYRVEGHFVTALPLMIGFAAATAQLRYERDSTPAGLSEQVHALAPRACDRMLGLELDDLAVDGCITKTPGAARWPDGPRSIAARAASSARS